MYLHAGNHKNIRQRDIIGIFDMDNATLSKISQLYLAAADARGEIESAREEIPKSFILYREKGKNKICFSPLSSTSLLGRCEETSIGGFEGER